MDTHLRSLERAAAAGDPAALAQALRQRRRSGELTTDRLRLAAYAGDPAARDALGDHAPGPAEDFGVWGEGFAACGREAAVRALLALADLAHDRSQDTPARGRAAEIVSEARHALRRWTSEPNDGTRRVVIRQGDELATLRELLPCDHRAGSQQLAAARAALHYACHVVGTNALDQLADIAANGMAIAGRALIGAGVPEAQVRAAVRDAITPWALGAHDPLQE